MTADRTLAANLVRCLAALLASLTLLSGCAASRDYHARTPGSSGAAKGRFGPNDATIRSKTASEPDRDGDGVLEVADKAPADGPASTGNYPPAPLQNQLAAPAPAGAPQAAPPRTPPPAEKKPDAQKEGARADGTEAPHETSMLIYTASVTMAVYQVDQGLGAVEKIARDNGGFLALKRDREITIRIPRARFDITLAAIDKIGDVLHRDIQAQDVTDEFVDAEIRIKNARAMQVRLKVLLDKANVKEALEIEKEMRRVTEELELLEGKLKLLKDKIAYSTITVTFQARGSAIQTTRIKLPFPWLTQLGLPSLLQLSEDR